MEPIKFEKHIKKELRNREIKPSDKAWDTISNALEAPRKKKVKRIFWYAVAAGFVGILIVSGVYVNSMNTENSNRQVVDQPIKRKKMDETKSREISKPDSQGGVVAIEKAKPPHKKVIPLIQNQVHQKNSTIVLGIPKPLTKKEEEVEKTKDPEAIMEAKITEVIAQATSLAHQNKTVTDAEVDSLLRNAQRELLADKIFMENQHVDAMVLLTEVEDELNQSFREQIFETLKHGVLKVRTALVDRNN